MNQVTTEVNYFQQCHLKYLKKTEIGFDMYGLAQKHGRGSKASKVFTRMSCSLPLASRIQKAQRKDTAHQNLGKSPAFKLKNSSVDGIFEFTQTIWYWLYAFNSFLDLLEDRKQLDH